MLQPLGNFRQAGSAGITKLFQHLSWPNCSPNSWLLQRSYMIQLSLLHAEIKAVWESQILLGTCKILSNVIWLLFWKLAILLAFWDRLIKHIAFFWADFFTWIIGGFENWTSKASTQKFLIESRNHGLCSWAAGSSNVVAFQAMLAAPNKYR